MPEVIFEWVNKGFTLLYGYTLNEYIEKKGNNITLTSSNPDFYKIFKRCIEQKVSITYTSKSFTKDEREIWVQTTLTPVLDNNDKITKFISIDSDITKMKQVENELETQRDQIEEQRDYINSQNIEITSSIYYAQNIQAALLPPQKFFTKIFPESFIFYKPREIVSGDFYWLSQKQDKIYVAAADCTGHGVPGALLSMLGTAFLTEIINENDKIKPSEVLSELRDYVGNSLHQTGEMGEMTDGLDISIISIDKHNNTLEFAGAMNPLFLVKKTNNNYSLTEIKGDRISIGVYEFKDMSFTNHKLKLQKDDTFYILTDGYTDQFGGENDEKFKKKRFKNVLLEMQYYSMNEQKEILIETFNKWKGANDQVDDILVIGIRV